MDESEYKVGQKAYYHVDGGVYHVRIIENNSDEISIKYMLKVLSIKKALFLILF